MQLKKYPLLSLFPEKNDGGQLKVIEFDDRPAKIKRPDEEVGSRYSIVNSSASNDY